MNMKFIDLGLRKEINQTLKANGFIEPTPIQKQAIPILLEGKDIIAQAQTGTGKTMAFVLPILEKVDKSLPSIQALIVTPTRELALQITAEVRKLTADLDGIHVLSVYGGQDVEQQMKKLKGAQHIVIATPGRLLDHLRRGTIDLSDVKMLVLDEADQMLHMGFLPEVETIIDNTTDSRQTMLFSATMPKPIKTLAKKYMNQPVEVHIESKKITLEEIEQWVVETTDRNKQATLRYLIDTYRPFMAIIFCRTKRRASTLNEALLSFGYQSDELHGDLTQAKREAVLKRFRETKLQLLVATDVAARGLDVEGVTHVFNYDIPQDAESYIHRIGRTGRAGGEGLAITLVAPKDRQYLELIEKGIQLEIERKEIDMPKAKQATENKDGGRTQSRAPQGKKQQNEAYRQRRERNIQRNADKNKKSSDSRSITVRGKRSTEKTNRNQRRD